MIFPSRFAVLLLFPALLGISQQSNPNPSPNPSQSQSAPQSSPTGNAPDDLPDSPGAQSQATPLLPTGPTAVFDTSMGRITCGLFQKEAPNTVANFIGLADGTKPWTDPVTKQTVTGKPFYDGTIFHRVIPDFMIQGGDRTGTGMGDPGYLFGDEFDPDLNFDVPGRLAMANSGPDTNGSQFFITEVPTPHLDQRHTIFGQCDEPSLSVVRAIARVDRNAQDKPLEPVTLLKLTIVPVGQPIPPPPAPPSQPAPQNP